MEERKALNYKEVMHELDNIWDMHNRHKLTYPNHAQQWQPERYSVKICTEDGGWGALPGVGIRAISEGIDWDDHNILIFTDQPIWTEPRTMPTHKWQNYINGISFECGACRRMVGKTDKYCKHCGKKFSDEIKLGIGYEGGEGTMTKLNIRDNSHWFDFTNGHRVDDEDVQRYIDSIYKRLTDLSYDGDWAYMASGDTLVAGWRWHDESGNISEITIIVTHGYKEATIHRGDWKVVTY